MKFLLLFIGLSFSINACLFSQTLFLYGDKRVSKQSFLKAFNKNPPSKEERRKALDEYLGLYINYKLKVQAGYDEGLNTQPAFAQESKTFKKQIADNIINDEAGIHKLTEEAFQRGMKDIHVSQVFVEIKGGDTAKAFQQINLAYKALQAGKAFNVVSKEFSTDEATKKTQGDLGYITVFTLGYDFENQIYTLKPNNYSRPYHSSFGYHIFKNMNERPAFGRRKIAQILISMPPDVKDAEKKNYKSLADSIYQLIQKGSTFESMATQYSNDYKTANNGGLIGEIGVGDYDTAYEKKVFSLKNVGEVTKPFESPFGFHIVKLLEKKMASRDLNDANAVALMKQQVEKDERLALFKKKILENRWLVVTKFKLASYDTNAFRRYTDSNILGKITNGIKEISDTTILFTFEKKKINASDWAVYITKYLNKALPDYSAKFKEFINYSCTLYYTDNIDLYSESMQEQAQEFDEANVLFAAMDRHVWGKAGSDVSALKDYYSKHKDKYQWAASVTALYVNCKTKAEAVDVAAKIKATPLQWRSIATAGGNDINIDSSRYEVTQLPIKQFLEFKEGFETIPEKNPNDDGFTFVYVLQPHPQKEQRSFEDAKGMVTNDYQEVLEVQWIESLKKQYPITVNQAVWKTVQ